MTIEQIELRKLLTQMLADNGINRETILDFTKSVIDEKVNASLNRIINEKNMDAQIDRIINDEIRSCVRSEVSSKVYQAFKDIHVTINCSSDKEENTL